MPRIFHPHPMQVGQTVVLSGPAARHVQVLRHQSGDHLTLFDGGAVSGGEFEAAVRRMGRSEVEVEVLSHHAVEREAALGVHLAVGMPANERMDWLVEKATELGVASIQPLMTERTVLRLSGERADKKQAHWQGIAVAACEQCGRNRVPRIHSVSSLANWLQTASAQSPIRETFSACFVLSLQAPAQTWQAGLARLGRSTPVTFLSGPEGGLSPQEEASAQKIGFAPASLGARVLRAETAALAALCALTLNP